MVFEYHLVDTYPISILGYDITYSVNTCDLYKSDPILREKQIKNVDEYVAGKKVNVKILSTIMSAYYSSISIFDLCFVVL